MHLTWDFSHIAVKIVSVKDHCALNGRSKFETTMNSLSALSPTKLGSTHSIYHSRSSLKQRIVWILILIMLVPPHSCSSSSSVDYVSVASERKTIVDLGISETTVPGQNKGSQTGRISVHGYNMSTTKTAYPSDIESYSFAINSSYADKISTIVSSTSKPARKAIEMIYATPRQGL